MEIWLFITTIAVGLLGAILFYLFQKQARERANIERQLTGFAEATKSLQDLQREFAGRIDQLSTQSALERAQLTEMLHNRLDGVSSRINDGLKEQGETTAKSLGRIGKHLEVIDRAQENIKDLAGQVIGLQDILDNKQARGAFGEVQLENLVRSILPPSAYSFQASLKTGKRVDCLIKLPNPPGSICVDSKFPLESYHQIHKAEDDGALKRAQRDFRTAVLKHVTDIRDRYIIAGETAESALMFLPSEAVYAELYANFQDVVEQSYRARVWIVSPTTLMATLNTVRAVLKDARMREQAGVIQTEVQNLMGDIGRLDKRVENLQKHFDQANRDVHEIMTSSSKISRRAERIDEMQLDDDSSALESLNPPTG
jgi:DNA recombination protein RmuC